MGNCETADKTQGSQFRILELFCGIGGCAAAVAHRGQIVAAVDINRKALQVYADNFAHPTQALTIESISVAQLQRWQADLWWLSPPCQPYTRRGLQRDLHDPRAQSLLALIEKLPHIKPRYLLLENVPGFQSSHMAARLRQTLHGLRYHIQESLLCPTQLGIPNRRLRFYLLASLCPVASIEPPPRRAWQFRLQEILDASPALQLALPAQILQQYASAIDVVDATHPQAVTSCFTAAYGRSWVRSGSYLRTVDGLRRFSPAEVARLLGFPVSFRFSAQLTQDELWRLLGNSLSVAVVQHLLQRILP